MDLPSTFIVLAVVGGLAFLVLISLAILDRVETLKISSKGKLNRADIYQ